MNKEDINSMAERIAAQLRQEAQDQQVPKIILPDGTELTATNMLNITLNSLPPDHPLVDEIKQGKVVIVTENDLPDGLKLDNQ